MRAGAEVYREVAERCSAYDKRERKSCFCNVAEGEEKLSELQTFRRGRALQTGSVRSDCKRVIRNEGTFSEVPFSYGRRMAEEIRFGHGIMLDIKEGGCYTHS